MAKQSGLGLSGVTVEDASNVAQDLTNDILDVTIDTPMGTFDVTGLDKFAFERLAMLQDAKVSYTFAWNPAAGGSVPVFTGDRTVPRQCVIPLPNGGGSGATATFTGLITSVSIPRPQSGQLTGKATVEMSNGTPLAWS